MNLLEGKTALVFGVANEKSIAWGITKAFHDQGARIGLSYAGEVLERRVRPLAESIGCTFVEACDVSRDEDIDRIVEQAKATFGQVDILVHSIAFAGAYSLSGPYFNVSREDFLRTMDISVYSLTALARAFQPLFRPGGSILTLTYYAAEKVFPNYNVMAIAKAALESSVRYLANDLGRYDVRVNAISAGPIRTLSAAGVAGFRYMYKAFTNYAPLHKPISIEDIGNAALFLCSDMSSKITGEVLFVDSGYNVLGAPTEIEV